MAHDFNYAILDHVAHRPSSMPMPGRPWVMTQTWNDLLFAHWVIDAALLRARVPRHFELDLFEGKAWIAVVPFHMTNVGIRGMPALPGLSAFPELNVRTYVRVGDRRLLLQPRRGQHARGEGRTDSSEHAVLRGDDDGGGAGGAG
jgi:Uncharacterized conserved protein (COG2071)